MGNSQPSMAQMEKTLFNMRLMSKQMQRQSKKCEKNIKSNKKKAAAAMKKGNMTGAKLAAQNAIREKTQAAQYLQLASKLDAVAGQVEQGVRMRQVTGAMGSVVQGMDSVLKSMNIERIAATMDKFEEQFESLGVRSGYMTDAMDTATATTAPESEVMAMMQEVAAENSLELADEMRGLSAPAAAAAAPAAAATAPAARLPMAAGPPPPAGGNGNGPAGGGGGAPPSGPPPPAGGGGGGQSLSDMEARLAALRGH